MKNPLPESVLRKYRLADFGESIRHVHYPKDMESLERARRRCVFQSFWNFNWYFLSMQEARQRRLPELCLIKAPTDSFIKSLPFELTDAQHRVFNEIYTDMTLPKTMNRLVQGDVGSGKQWLRF